MDKIEMDPKTAEMIKNYAIKTQAAKNGTASPHELTNEKVDLNLSCPEKKVFCINRVDTTEDLLTKPGINICPPPEDGRCNCCERSINELKPFGKAGDPLVGNFEGALLLKNFRPGGPFNEELVSAYEEAENLFAQEDPQGFLEVLVYKYGEEKANEILIYGLSWHTTESSWECRDCFLLDSDEYFQKRSASFNHEEQK